MNNANAKSCSIIWLCLITAIILGHATVTISAATGKTFLMPRPIASQSILYKSGFDSFLSQNEMSSQDKIDSSRLNLSVTHFYQQSMNSKNLAKYFMPHGKTELQIKGAKAPGGDFDISGTWLQIAGNTPDGTKAMLLNDFESKIKIDPEFRSFGTTLYLHKVIRPKIWASMLLPFAQAETKMNLSEFDMKNNVDSKIELERLQITNTSISEAYRREVPSNIFSINAKEAFTNPNRKYGKIGNSRLKETGLADITLMLGFSLIKNLNIYSSLVVPTSNKPSMEYMFEPMIGNGRRWSFGCGIDHSCKLHKKRNIELFWDYNIDYKLLLPNIQKRSFDLKDNETYSRYLLVVGRNSNGIYGDILEPGINHFTRDARVGLEHHLNLENRLRFSKKSFNLELCYNPWIKSKETLSKIKNMEAPLFLPSYTAENNNVLRTVFKIKERKGASIKTHLNDVTGVGDITPNSTGIATNDFDKNSAQTPFIFNHALSARLSLNSTWQQSPIKTTLLSEIELAKSNSSLEKWLIGFSIKLLV
jgi:hypothetical protein